MNEEVEVGGCQSYENEVHNEFMFIGDSNVWTFIRGTDKEDVQTPIQANKESTSSENSFFNIPPEFSGDIQASDSKQRESNMDEQVSIHAEMFIPHYSFEKTLCIHCCMVLNAGEDTKAGVSAKVQGLLIIF